jgi:hypothetical protein
MNAAQLLFGGDYTITRLLLQRGVAAIYLFAFLAAAMQWKGLLGAKGLLPVQKFLERASVWQTPSLFHFASSDQFALLLAWLGVAISSLALVGLTERYGLGVSMLAWGVLFILYLSFVNVGQVWYAFGWESILLEAGFLAIFLGSRDVEPSVIVIWLYRWLLFRVMFGAGLIKMRGDECWRDFTCLIYHHETQPMPNPLSWYAHHSPVPIHKLGVVGNHVIELVVPFFYFLWQPLAGLAGLSTIVFHLILITSGNYSWLNWLTLVLAFSTFNTEFLKRVLPISELSTRAPPLGFEYAALTLGVLMAIMSIPAVLNMMSRNQVMNTSFNPLHLAGSYGAFGNVTKERYEIIVEGTADDPADPAARWQTYEFRGKPGEVSRRPPQVAPYHLRLDWLMWFAAFRPQAEDVWFWRLTDKLLAGEPAVTRLLRHNPFPEAPPRAVRARYFRYYYTTAAERRETGAWWRREEIGPYLPPVTREHPLLQELRQEFEPHEA